MDTKQVLIFQGEKIDSIFAMRNGIKFSIFIKIFMKNQVKKPGNFS